MIRSYSAPSEMPAIQKRKKEKKRLIVDRKRLRFTVRLWLYHDYQQYHSAPAEMPVNTAWNLTSGIHEYAPDLFFQFFPGPLGMLAFQEGSFVPAHRPVQIACGLPAFLRRHPPQNLDLFRAGLLIAQHSGHYAPTPNV